MARALTRATTEMATNSAPTVREQLPVLLRSTKQAYLAATLLGGKDDDLLVVLRRLLVHQLLDERPTIAIVGSQGAGKTTLAMMLYDLEPALLGANVGRGEVVPVRIVEVLGKSDVSAYAFTVASEPPTGEVARELIPVNELPARAKGAGKGDVLLEIEVPPRYFGGGDACFLLLPGFEDEKSDWDAVARLGADSATGCLLAVEPAAEADERTRVSSARTVEQFQRGRAAIALTKGDASADRHAAFRLDFLKKYAVPKHLGGRVVATWLLPPETRGEWIAPLGVALGRILPTDRRASEDKLAHLEAVVQDDLGVALIRLRDARAQLRSDDLDACLRIDEILKPYDAAVKKVRTSYAGKLRTAFRNHATAALAEVERGIMDRDEFDKMWTALFGVSLEDQVRFRESIHTAWNPARARELHLRVIAAVVGEQIGVEVRAPLQLSAYMGNGLPVDSAAVRGTEQLVSLGRKEQPTWEKPPTEIGDALRNLPAMLLEYARLAEVDAAAFRGHGPAGEGNIGRVVEEFKGAAESQKTIFKLIGGMLAVDVAADGKLDTIPRLAEVVGIGAAPVAAGGGGAAAAAGAATATPAVIAAGAILVAAAAVVTIRQVNRSDIEEAGQAADAFAGVAESVTATAVSQYDVATSCLRDALVRRLERVFQLDVLQARLLRCDIALAGADEARVGMLEAIRGRR